MIKNETTTILIVFGILIILFSLVLVSVGRNVGVDEATERLCRWYAQQDHSGEIGKERLEKMGYLWQDFDWYGSCILNNK